MYSHWSKHRAFDESDTRSHTNDRYLTTPEKKRRFDGLRKSVCSRSNKAKGESAKLQGNCMDKELHSDLLHIMHENVDYIRKAYPESSFSHLFWDEQLKAASTKDPHQVKWHPVLIKVVLKSQIVGFFSIPPSQNKWWLPPERTLANKPVFQRPAIS